MKIRYWSDGEWCFEAMSNPPGHLAEDAHDAILPVGIDKLRQIDEFVNELLDSARFHP
jgi:hypothetical protein